MIDEAIQAYPGGEIIGRDIPGGRKMSGGVSEHAALLG